MLSSKMKLNAIVWKAKSVGQTYGMFCAFLSEEDKDEIYLEYEQFLENRNKEEKMRLEKSAEERTLSRAKIKKISSAAYKKWLFY